MLFTPRDGGIWNLVWPNFRVSFRSSPTRAVNWEYILQPKFGKAMLRQGQGTRTHRQTNGFLKLVLHGANNPPKAISLMEMCFYDLLPLDQIADTSAISSAATGASLRDLTLGIFGTSITLVEAGSRKAVIVFDKTWIYQIAIACGFVFSAPHFSKCYCVREWCSSMQELTVVHEAMNCRSAMGCVCSPGIASRCMTVVVKLLVA